MWLKEGPFLDDFIVGEEIITEGRTITRSDVVNFAGVSGDFAPLHMDMEYGRKTIFGQSIAHGLGVLAFASGKIVSSGIFDNLIAFYGIEEWQFSAPLFFGDTIRSRIRVKEKRATDKGGRGLVDLYIEIINQKDVALEKGVWRVMIKEKP